MAKFGHPNIVAPQSEANDVAAYVRDQIQIYVMFLNTLKHMDPLVLIMIMIMETTRGHWLKLRGLCIRRSVKGFCVASKSLMKLPHTIITELN